MSIKKSSQRLLKLRPVKQLRGMRKLCTIKNASGKAMKKPSPSKAKPMNQRSAGRGR
jgi:hypothetical protein